MRYSKEIFLSLLIIWYMSFVCGFAFGQTTADCSYVNIVTYNSKQEIISSKQEYICNTPPQITHVHTYPNKDAMEVMNMKVYGIPLASYENPAEVIYNMNMEIVRANTPPAIDTSAIEGLVHFLSMLGK